MSTRKMSIRDLCYISIFSAVIAVCAQISIPMPYGIVPLTLQTFAIMLAGAVLGVKNGTIATLLYVLLGAVGVPVFSLFTGGIGIVVGPTGGFILSFPLLALAAGVGASKDSRLWLTLWIAIGMIVNYASGIIMYSIVTSTSLSSSFFIMIQFIPTDIIKVVIVIASSKTIKQALIKSGALVYK